MLMFDFLTEIECGKPIATRSQIFGGNETCLGCIPWQVALENVVENGTQDCGGTIVSPRYVVTAAHCVWGKSPEDVKVHAGIVDYLDEDATIHRVKKLHIHDEYYDEGYDYDYAILELENPIDIEGDSRSRAACLPDKNDGKNFDENTVLRTSGWGFGSDEPNLLKDIFVTWKSEEVCQPLMPVHPVQGEPIKYTPRMICAGHGPEEIYDRACKGDSGGNFIPPIFWTFT